jgi:hypothetical protein
VTHEPQAITKPGGNQSTAEGREEKEGRCGGEAKD